jgi:hypothetical protein
MPTMMILRWKTKNVEFWETFQFLSSESRNDVITSTFFVDLESIHQGLSFEVLHDIVTSNSKFDLGVSNFRPAAKPMKVKADRLQK